jgi:hypothetical protein
MGHNDMLTQCHVVGAEIFGHTREVQHAAEIVAVEERPLGPCARNRHNCEAHRQATLPLRVAPDWQMSQ